eukprot:m.37744 g.37744  ORF g.37744 m.37744 type:complete len:1053 (-) comp6757_c1_seq1:228-3386(-)
MMGGLTVVMIVMMLVLGCIQHLHHVANAVAIPSLKNSVDPEVKEAILDHYKLHRDLRRQKRFSGSYDKFVDLTKGKHPLRKGINSLYETIQPFVPQFTDGPEDYNIFNNPTSHKISYKFDESDDTSARLHRRDADCPNGAPPVSTDDIEIDHHTFDPDAISITFFWIGRPRSEIVALQSFRGDRKRANLLCSTDYGMSYAACHGVTRPIVQVEKVVKGEHTWIFALPSFDSSEYTNTDFANAMGFYVSYDSSNSFVFHPTSHHFEYIMPHPRNGEELLAFIQDDQSVSYSVDDVYYITNYRQGSPIVTLLEKYVHVAEWSTSDTPGAEHDVLLTQYRNEPGLGDAEIEPLDFIRIRNPNSQTVKTTLKENCYDFLEEEDFLFTTQVPSTDGFDERALFVSSDEGDSFKEAIFPFDARHNHFKVVDATEGVVFVLVQHTITRVEGGTFVFRIDSPASIAGNYSATKSLFSPVIPGGIRSGSIFIEVDNPKGCSEHGGVSSEAKGKIVLIDRGDCYFTEKVENAETAGAIGVIIVNTDDNINFRMAGQGEEIDVPAFIITKSAGDTIRNNYVTTGSIATVSMIEDFVEEQAMRKTSNLFVSDHSGVLYTLSLDDVVYIPYYQSAQREIADVEKVNGQPGTYFVSYFSSTGIETLITFNKGGSWREIVPPNSECGRLSVALDSMLALEDIPLPLSTTTAPGVIVANAAASHDTYPSLHISVDGGVTWSKENSRPHSYMMLDHAGVIIISESHTASPDILITLDLGKDGWTSVKVADSDEYLQMISEPGSATLEASVYFYDTEWKGTHFNLTPLFKRPCNLNNIGAADGDYDVVSPGETVGSDVCLLGREHHFIRRAPCKRCFNGLDHEAKYDTLEDENIVTCDCAVVDYACAPGFVRDDKKNEFHPCDYDTAFAKEIVCTGSSTVELVNNYIKVFGDECTDGKHSSIYEGQIEVPCVGSASSSKNSIGIVTGEIIVPVIIVLVLAIFIYRNRSKLGMFSLHRASVQYHAVEEGNDDSEVDEVQEGEDDDEDDDDMLDTSQTVNDEPSVMHGDSEA